MSPQGNVILVGPMGAGKTTIGKHLARLFNKQFLDLDHEIETRCGADIPWIFDVEGEQGFRQRETALLGELLKNNNIVLATGGGVVVSADNRRLLSANGYVVYLAVGIEDLYERTRQDTRRPLLQVADRRKAIERILQERDPLYREVADLVFYSQKQSPAQVAEELADKITLAPG